MIIAECKEVYLINNKSAEVHLKGVHVDSLDGDGLGYDIVLRQARKGNLRRGEDDNRARGGRDFYNHK